MKLRRIHPDGAELDLAHALDELDLGAWAPPGRPYAIANMVSSADGRAVLEGRSGGLSGETDRELFHMLRERVDAVMVGAGTLRVERYGAIVRDPDRQARREALGLARQPLAVVMSRRLDVPWDIPLFDTPEQTVVVFTESDAPAPATTANVIIDRAAPGTLELGRVLGALRDRYGVRALLCEGGPTLLADLVRARVLDELFLVLAPKLAGGLDLLTILRGDIGEPAELELAWALLSGSELFLRYRLR